MCLFQPILILQQNYMCRELFNPALTRSNSHIKGLIHSKWCNIDFRLKSNKDENSATKHHPYATETFMLSGEKMAGVQKYETHFAIVC